MADTEVLKILKDIPFRVQSASLKERRKVFEEIQGILSSEGINEAVVKYVCRVLLLTLNRYRDSTSRSYVKDLIASLTSKYREWTLLALQPVLLEFSEQLKNTHTSKSTCLTGLFALQWTSVLVEGSLKVPLDDKAVDYNAIVIAQANLLASVTAYGDQKKNNKAYSVMQIMWNSIDKDCISKWWDVLLAQPADAGPHISVAFSALCKYEPDVATKHKSKMLDSFIKSIISVKTRPNSNYIRGCSALLHRFQKTDVQEVLLPALQKAMLRSPETIVQGVGVIVENLDVFLDGVIVDIGKNLIVNLHSKDEWVRQEALTALSLLSRRVSDLTAAKALLNHAFAEYHGASGKLTSSEDKIAVLNGISTLSELAISPSDLDQLYTEVCKQSAKVLDSESHERTLCAALEALHCWTQRLPEEKNLPEQLIEMFKKNLPLKTSTQPVRCAYVSLISRALRRLSPQPSQAEALRNAFGKAVEKAVQQPLQHPIVNEGICAMLGLTLLDTSRDLPSKGAIWTAVTHPDKHVLLQDKVLASANDDVLIQVVLLCRTLLENYQSVANDPNSPIYRAFISVLLSTVKSVRTIALEEVKGLVANQNRALIARYLVEKLHEVLDDGKIFGAKDKDEKGTEITGKMVLDCVQAICSYTDYSPSDAQALAISALPSCSHPLCTISPQAWRRLLSRLRLDSRKLIALHSNTLTHKYIVEYVPTETMSNIISTLVSTNSEVIAKSAIHHALDILQDPELLRVTRDEYFTYLTPEGELYDKSAVPGNDDTKEMNLKRESKAYSYKDQLEELQLRRELEDKKRKDGKGKEAPLSAKQKEAIKAQLAKESAVRQRLTALTTRVTIAISLIQSVCRGSMRSIQALCRPLATGVLGALKSPLVAPQVTKLYYDLTLKHLTDKVLADHVARTTIRLHKPQCDLDPLWEQEDLQLATARVIDLVYDVTAARREHSDDSYLTAPGFCYVFPLFSKGLSLPSIRSNETTMVHALNVISHHASFTKPKELLHPALFPIDNMFRLLIDLISSTSGRVQAACTVALLETGKCVAKPEQSVDLSLEELTCLLAGLQSPLEVVRDAALRTILCVIDLIPKLLENPDNALEITKRLFIATFDESEDNKALGEEVWRQLPLAQTWSREPELVTLLLKEVQHPAEPIQRAAARALAHRAADQHTVLQQAIQIYTDKLPLIPAKLDQFGHITEAAIDEWGARRGVALALTALAPKLAPGAVAKAMAFFVDTALGDRNDTVRLEMLNAAMTIVEVHGKVSDKFYS